MLRNSGLPDARLDDRACSSSCRGRRGPHQVCSGETRGSGVREHSISRAITACPRFATDSAASASRSLLSTRWPSKELVEDRSQGVQLATMQALARYWANRVRLAQGRGEAQRAAAVHDRDRRGRDPLHPRRSPHEDALPLIMTHGWPGSVIELLETIGPLTDPTAHGGTREDAFHLVLPSLPGYGFSSEPTELGWDAGRTARVGGADAPPRLHPLRRPGRRRGCPRHGPDGPPGGRGFGRLPPEPAHGRCSPSAINCPRESEQERAAAEAVATFRRTASATSSRWPRGRRRSATPCWIHPSGWRPGCSTTTRTATTRSPAPSSTASPWATSPGTTSSTTSRCTG